MKGQEQTGSDQQKVYENENEAYSFLTNTNSTTSATNTNNNINTNNELYRGYDFSSGSLDSSDDSDTNDDETGRLIKHDSIRGDLKWNHTLPGKYNDLILQILDCKLFQVCMFSFSLILKKTTELMRIPIDYFCLVRHQRERSQIERIEFFIRIR